LKNSSSGANQQGMSAGGHAADLQELLSRFEREKMKIREEVLADLPGGALDRPPSIYSGMLLWLRLTARELEVCKLIGSRTVNRDIARILGISLKTVEKHRDNIRRKFGIRNRRINLAVFIQTLYYPETTLKIREDAL